MTEVAASVTVKAMMVTLMAWGVSHSLVHSTQLQLRFSLVLRQVGCVAVSMVGVLSAYLSAAATLSPGVTPSRWDLMALAITVVAGYFVFQCIPKVLKAQPQGQPFS